MKTTMGVKLDEDTRDRLKILSELKDRTPHWLMKKAIMEYLDREESYEREKQEDMQRWQQYLDTGEYIDHDTMEEKLTSMANKARNKRKNTG